MHIWELTATKSVRNKGMYFMTTPVNFEGVSTDPQALKAKAAKHAGRGLEWHNGGRPDGLSEFAVVGDTTYTIYVPPNRA